MRGFFFLCGLGIIVALAYGSKPHRETAAMASYYAPNIYFVAFAEGSSFQFHLDALQAMQDWENKAPGLIFQVQEKPCYHDHCLFLVGMSLSSLAQEHGDPTGEDRYIGWCDNQVAPPIKVEVGDPLFQVAGYALRHELGHAIGLGHGGEDTVMYWHTDHGSNKVACADVAAYYASISERMPDCEDLP